MPYKDAEKRKEVQRERRRQLSLDGMRREGVEPLDINDWKSPLECTVCGCVSGRFSEKKYRHYDNCAMKEVSDMSNNAPLDPNNREEDDETLESRHATVTWCMHHMKMAMDIIPDLAINDQVKRKMEDSLGSLKAEETRLRGALMRTRMPDA